MPFELSPAEDSPAPASRFEPLRPSYNPLPADDGGEETLLFGGSDKEVKAPSGTGRMFAEIENDSLFDPPESSSFDEAEAVFEKQAAYVALVANAYGLVPDEDISDFVASRSRALANAQKNQPEYMKQFQSEFEGAKGFWETTAVILSNPRAIGRTAITQAPNSALPLITTYIGAKGGAVAGGVAGSVVPGVGTGAGAGIGAIAGGMAGSVPGSALVEIGSTIDQLMSESGVDVTDASQVLKALQNDTFMNDIKIKAERKGLTTASVDALFQIVGGKFTKAMMGKGAAKVAGGVGADIAVQSVGEFTSEAAGQQAAFGKVDYKDAALEAVSSIATSAGQTAIGALVPGKQKAQTQPLTPAPPMPIAAEEAPAAPKQEPAASPAAQATAPPQNAPVAPQAGAVAQTPATAPVTEGLQKAAAAEANQAIAPILSQEKKAQQDKVADIQAETDDISVNLLREITALQESKTIVDPDVEVMLEETRSLLQERRKTPKPFGLTAFLKKRGGVKESGGELTQMNMKNRAKNGARNDKDGLSLDAAREAAAEAGYIDEDATIEDFLVALDADFNGRGQVMAAEDIGTQSKLDEIDIALSTIDKELNSRGITYNRKGLDELRKRVAANKATDSKIARETKAGEAKLTRLEAAKLKAESSPSGILADKLKTFIAGMRKGGVLQKSETKAVQAQIIETINASGLEASDRAKFISTIKNTQTIEQLEASLPEITQKLEKYKDHAVRRDLIASIKKVAAKAKSSSVIAADYSKAILDIVGEFDMVNRKPETNRRLVKTLTHFANNPDATAPKWLTRKLAILSKKPIADLTTQELDALHSDISRMVETGKAKQALKALAKERRQEKRIAALQGKIVPISSKPLATASVGERISLLDEVKNKFTNAANKARSVSLALNPMDVVFDMMDGNADYKGAAHTIFKKAIDASFGRYLNRKESVTRDVKNLADKLNLDDKNFERIGVYAAAQQENGLKKLEASGISQEEVDAITLTAEEKQFYDLMRKKLDAMFPDINKVMVSVYNQNVEQVSDYFPFMTDFEAMQDSNIEDMLGGNAPSLVAMTPEQGVKLKKKNVERGFTKSRTGGKQAIRIDAMNVFLRHVDNATYLIEMSQDIKELGELAQSTQFRDMAGDMSQQFVTDWIALLARKGGQQDRIAALDAFRVNVGAAVLGFKLSSILIQPTALADGAALVGGNYVARGVKEVATNAEWRAFLKKNLPEIRERAGDDPAYLDMGGKSAIAHVREAGFWALKNVDLLSASSVAAGAYMRAVEQRGGVVDLANPDPAAIEEAQLYLRRTQSSAFAKDTPMIISSGKLTGNTSLDKLIFQFQSFMLNRWSVIKHDVAKVGVGRGKTAQAVNGAAFLLLAMSMEIGVRRLSKEVIAAMVGGDDLDPWEDTVKEEAVKTALGQIPIVSTIVGSMEYGSNPVPAISMMNDIFKKLQYAAASKSEDKKMKHYSSAAILAIGTGLGIPGTLQLEQLSRKLQTEEKKSKTGY